MRDVRCHDMSLLLVDRYHSFRTSHNLAYKFFFFVNEPMKREKNKKNIEDKQYTWNRTINTLKVIKRCAQIVELCNYKGVLKCVLRNYMLFTYGFNTIRPNNKFNTNLSKLRPAYGV